MARPTSENLKFRIDPALKAAWLKLCQEKNVTQTAAQEAMMRFLLAQDDIGRSMILGQLRPTPELIRLALTRAGKR